MREIICEDCGILTVTNKMVDEGDYCESCREHHQFCRCCGCELFDEYYKNEGYCSDCL